MRAQVTLFVIAGLMLLIVAGLIYSARGLLQVGPMHTSDAKELKAYVEACLDSATREGIQFTAAHGGFYEPVTPFLEFGWIEVPYYYGYGTIPAMQDVQTQLSLYISDYMQSCLGDFSSFREKGFEVRYGDIAPETVISERVTARLHMPVTLVHNSRETKMELFSSAVSINLKRLYDAAETVVNGHAIDSIPVSTLGGVAASQSLDFELTRVGHDKIVYSIIDKGATINQQPVILNFGAHYGWFDQDLAIEPIPEQNLTTEYAFSYQVRANRPGAVFTTESALFEMSRSGQIAFMPAEEHLGSHEIIITAHDLEGRTTEAVMRISVMHENESPYLEFIPDQLLAAGQALGLKATAHDDGQVWYSLETENDAFSIDPRTGEISGTAESGRFRLTVTAMDAAGGTHSRSFVVVVE